MLSGPRTNSFNNSGNELSTWRSGPYRPGRRVAGVWITFLNRQAPPGGDVVADLITINVYLVANGASAVAGGINIFSGDVAVSANNIAPTAYYFPIDAEMSQTNREIVITADNQNATRYTIVFFPSTPFNSPYGTGGSGGGGSAGGGESVATIGSSGKS